MLSMPVIIATPAKIRAWARANDIKVGQRGRLHRSVIAAYLRAHPEEVDE